MVKTKTVVILAGAGLALYLVYTRKEKLMDEENSDFREGYVNNRRGITPKDMSSLKNCSMATL